MKVSLKGDQLTYKGICLLTIKGISYLKGDLLVNLKGVSYLKGNLRVNLMGSDDPGNRQSPYQPDTAVERFHEDKVSGRTDNLDATVEDDIFGDYPSVNRMEAVVEHHGPVGRINGSAYDCSGIVEVYIAVLRVYADGICARALVHYRIVEVDIVFGEYGPDAGEFIAVEVDMAVYIYGFIDVEVAVEALAGVVISALALRKLLYLLGKIGHLYIAAEGTLLSNVCVGTVQSDPADSVEHAGDDKRIVVAVVAEAVVGMDASFHICVFAV